MAEGRESAGNGGRWGACTLPAAACEAVRTLSADRADRCGERTCRRGRHLTGHEPPPCQELQAADSDRTAGRSRAQQRDPAVSPRSRPVTQLTGVRPSGHPPGDCPLPRTDTAPRAGDAPGGLAPPSPATTTSMTPADRRRPQSLCIPKPNHPRFPLWPGAPKALSPLSFSRPQPGAASSKRP